MRLSTIRGMRDYFGADALLYNTVTQLFVGTAGDYGYDLINTPILERESVFTASLGETSDVITKEMYAFLDNSGDRVALRPEGTASVVRALVENSLFDRLPAKFCYFGPMFRYERPQKGRYRQFHQLGVECFSSDDPAMRDAEAILLAHRFLRTLDLDGDFELEISTLGDLDDRSVYLSKLKDYFESNRSRLSEISVTRLEKNPLRILDSKEPQDQEIVENAPGILEFLGQGSRALFDSVLKGLESAGVLFSVNQRIVRGLDYYTHTVFEFKSNNLGAQSTILAGGRYNNFVKLFDGPDLPGTGWAAGFERLALLTSLKPKLKCLFAVLTDDPESSIPVLENVRSAGWRAEMFIGNSFKKLFAKAARYEARFAIIIGQNERNSGIVTVKDMETTEQQSVQISEIAKYVKSLA